MSNNNTKQSKSSGSVPEKKMWMRIVVLAVCAVMIIGIIILPLLWKKLKPVELNPPVFFILHF